MPVSAARHAAFRILLEIERGHAHSDDLLRAPTVSALSPADRNLTTTLVLGVLRWQLDLDRRLQQHLKRPNAKLDPEILIALRLGAFQLLQLDRIPARAAIDQSVELTKQSGHRFASGMVNAVLRKLSGTAAGQQEQKSALQRSGTAKKAREGPQDASPERNSPQANKSLGEPQPNALRPVGGAVDTLSEIAAHPAWMVERWTHFFGDQATCDLCLHGQTQPALAIRLVDPAAEDELQQANIDLAPGELLTSARIVLSGDVTATDAFRQGRVRIQDEGSQLIAEIAGRGSAILDCCAAPGGKTLVLAERNPEAHIVACEASPSRFEALRHRLAPLAARVECRLADATQISDAEAYDLVLADVPCSGTGTLGRNPEIRHRLRPEDIARQAGRQRAILAAALRAARPGGRVLYSTCSLEPEENEQVIAAVLNQQPARIVPLNHRVQEMLAKETLVAQSVEKLQHCITPEGFLRLVPGTFHTDGFFVALLER